MKPNKPPSIESPFAAGVALRKKVPRAAHARWKPRRKHRDVIAMLEESNRGRVPHLVPIRYGRMLHSPFAFLRGAASIMAFDLAATPASGIRVQACGDAHILNFGGFATPERRLVFDVNDFDETLPAPWEWDVKRLAASAAVAARGRGIGRPDSQEITAQTVGAYREAMAFYASMGLLERWYQRIDANEVPGLRAEPQAPIAVARRLKDEPPLMVHPKKGDKSFDLVRQFISRYRHSLIEDRRVLLDRYTLVDVALKVVGVGSVGRRCFVALLMAGDDDALLLQLKEARASVLEPYAGKSLYPNHGQRVVEGQRLMQAASDIFIGWSRIAALHAHFYVRQLHDRKTKARINEMNAREFKGYLGCCARALARSHAKAGAAAAIAGYLGKRNAFDTAVAAFAERYADQTEADYETLKKAAKAGRIPVDSA
ncbi:MAG: DUF2252 domain-containing protein [Usitatibacter sp.]